MDKQARAALALTRELHTGVTKLGPTSEEEERVRLRKLAARVHNAVAALRKVAADEARRGALERTMLREAVVGEGIDRQANAARVQERVRHAVDRVVIDAGIGDDSAAGALIERAKQTVATIDASLDALCPHARAPPAGSALLEQLRGGTK